MDAATRDALRALNRRFYTRHGSAFAASRGRPWPGWQRLIGHLPAAGGRLRVLDVGCGNARLAAFLAAGRQLDYLGIDSAPTLLAAAPSTFAGALVCADVLAPLPLAVGRRFQLVAVFGLLHHLPGRRSRRRLVRRLGRRLSADGVLALTAWRFAEVARFADRRLSWSRYNREHPAAAIDPDRLEAGDHLLTWNGDRRYPRYCHALDDAELAELTAAAGLAVAASFTADGREGDLNRYLLLARP